MIFTVLSGRIFGQFFRLTISAGGILRRVLLAQVVRPSNAFQGLQLFFQARYFSQLEKEDE